MGSAAVTDLRRVLALKRAALQTRIDALAARDAKLLREIAAVAAQPDGLAQPGAPGAFQIAARAMDQARERTAQLTAERASLVPDRDALAREKLALDIAERKLAEQARADARLAASRAADRA